MPIESATYVNQLVLTNPTSSDKKITTDDQLRLVKKAVTKTFTGLINNEVSASAGEMNQLVGVTSNLQTQLNATRGLYSDLTSGASTAGNAVLWNGATKHVSTSSAVGGTNDDLWFQYE